MDDEEGLSAKRAKWAGEEDAGMDEMATRWSDESCRQLELELLITENKQLRAQVALLAHEKDSALSMWRNERQKNKELLRLLARTQASRAGTEERAESSRQNGSSPPLNLQGGLLAPADQAHAEDAGRCLPTSSGRAALQITGEILTTGRNVSSHSSVGTKRRAAGEVIGGTGVSAKAMMKAMIPTSPFSSRTERKPSVDSEEGSESQPLVSKREQRRKELFPQQPPPPPQYLSLSPFPNESKIAEAKRRRVATSGLSTPLSSSSKTSTTPRGRKGEKLQESRISTAARAAQKPQPTPLMMEPTTPLMHRSPGASASADTTPLDGDVAATGPKDYGCRDCKRKFCRRGDRDNHELLCGHTKWRNGQSLTLGFVELD